VTEGREGRSVRAGEYARGAGFCMLTDGRQPPAPLPQRSKCSCACWRSLCSPPWLCMDANAHEPRPRPQASALPLPRLSPGTRLPGTYSCVVAALPLMRVLQRFDAASADCLPPQMKMVQLSLALACLLAGADAFGVTPPEVTKPTDGPPAFIVHEGVGWCRSNLNENMEWYVGEDGSFEDGVDKTADKCWKACQAKNPVVGRFHDFFNDGKKTWCYCHSGCECMEDVGNDNTLAPPDWKAPSACSSPSPPPPSPAPAFIVYEGVGYCQSDLDASMPLGEDKSADACWTACQAKYPDEGGFHEYRLTSDPPRCYCQSGCKCMKDVGISNTLAPPDWKVADACLSDTVSSAITCSEGGAPDEIGWSLSCGDDDTTLSGGAPYLEEQELAVARGATCTLDMTDSFGDGWQDAEWTGFGQIFTMEKGLDTETKTFVVGYDSYQYGP